MFLYIGGGDTLKLLYAAGKARKVVAVLIFSASASDFYKKLYRSKGPFCVEFALSGLINVS